MRAAFFLLSLLLCIPFVACAVASTTSTVVRQEVRNDDVVVPPSVAVSGNGYFAGFSIALPVVHVQQETSGVVPILDGERTGVSSTIAPKQEAMNEEKPHSILTPSPVFYVPTEPRIRSAYTDDVTMRVVESGGTSEAHEPAWKTYTDVVLYGMRPTHGYTDIPERKWNNDGIITFRFVPDAWSVPVRSSLLVTIVRFVSHVGEASHAFIHDPYPNENIPVDLVGFVAYATCFLLGVYGVVYFAIVRFF